MDVGCEHDLELTGLHLSARGAARTHACTRCGELVEEPAQVDPVVGRLEGVDRRPGLDFTIDDLTDEERHS